MKIIAQCLLFSVCSISLLAQSAEVIDQKIKTYSAEVYFDFALYELKSETDSTFQEIVRFLQSQDEAYTIKITAHTDFVGSNERNLILSQNRADAVKNYLIEKGIAAEVMEATVFGEEQPQATNDTDQGRQLNRRATIDIFKIQKMLPLSAKILDEESGLPIAADVIIRTKTSRDSLRADKDGMVQLPVPIGAVIGIDIYSKCYFLHTKMFKATAKNLANLKFKLKKAEAGKIADIDNLYFVGNRDTLLRKSEPELPKILKFMQLNDCLKIQIAGHVNVPNRPNVSENSSHFDLSTRRAKMVYEYLIENGIAEDRLEYKGYGNWEMRYPNARAETRQAQNRRVEIRILKSDKDETCLCEMLLKDTAQ